MLISETIRLFLDSIGRSEEYEYYLKKFRSDRSSCFAILCPDEEACQAGGENLRMALQFLQRLDLVPALLLTGPHAENMRRTLTPVPGAFTVYRPRLRAPRSGFGERGAGKSAQDAEVELVCELGAAVQLAQKQKKGLAIVWEQEMLQPALAFLSRQLSTRIYFIRMAGALRDANGAELLYYHYRGDGTRLFAADEGLAELVNGLMRARDRLHLSVTAPYNLLKEIFTVKGAGTIVRAGSQIHRFHGAGELDRARLLALLGQSFQKPLIDEGFLERASDLYVEENYQGAIIIESQEMGSYLSKFAVDKHARGLGIAQELWDEVIRQHPALFWRSRRNNSVNRWYASLADGLHRAPPHWNVFWRGVASADIPRIIEFCVNRPEDFAPAVL
jgi:acetylglutamate kinase